MGYNRAAIMLAAKAANDSIHKFNEYRGMQRGTQLWKDLNEEQRHVLITAATRVFESPNMTPEACHELWLADKERLGWKHGEEFDPVSKLHPAMLPYIKLNDTDKLKDVMYMSIISAFCVMSE